VEPAAERRHEMWCLPGVHDVDLHALTDQGEQRGEGLVEGHGLLYVFRSSDAWVSPRTHPNPAQSGA
jgi:hypothetical protein